MSTTLPWAVLCGTALLIAPSCLRPQDRTLRDGVNLSVAALNSDSGDHYLGGSISYFRYVSRIFGLKASGAYFPETMLRSGPFGGGKTASADGTALVGWHGRRFSVMAEVGGGELSVVVAGGANTNGVVYFTKRRYPAVILGGIVEKSLTRRLAFTYELRDNWAFMSAYPESIGGASFDFAAIQTHEPELRGGFTFCFE